MAESAPIQFYDELPEFSLTEVFELLDLTAKNLRRIQRQVVSEAGLTPPQYYLLQLLWEQDERPSKELADALACTRATITGIVDTLERKGLVTRQTNRADRRSVLVKLTDKGREVQQSTPSLEKIFTSCCAGLTPLEFQQLGRLLRRLNDSLTCGEEN